MEELDNFSLNYLQGFNNNDDVSFLLNENIHNLYEDDDLLFPIWDEENVMNDFPSVWEQDATETTKKKLQASSHFEKMKTDICLNDAFEESLFNFSNNVSSKIPEPEKEEAMDSEIQEGEFTETELMTVTELTKQSTTENSQFINPVKNEKRKRFSKKYDKGKDFSNEKLFIIKIFWNHYCYNLTDVRSH